MIPTDLSPVRLLGMVVAILLVAVAGSVASVRREELYWQRIRRTRVRNVLLGMGLCFVMGVVITVIEWWTGR